uniref:Putative secreted peptide n=1 Tax=Anopheles braziliensis TaxID=58242 RepID=A0A2M3ZU04_9DIPT
MYHIRFTAYLLGCGTINPMVLTMYVRRLEFCLFRKPNLMVWRTRLHSRILTLTVVIFFVKQENHIYGQNLVPNTMPGISVVVSRVTNGF